MTIPHYQCTLYDQLCNISMTGKSKRKSKNIMNGTTPQCAHQYSSPLYLQNRLTMSSDSNDRMTNNLAVVKSQNHPKKS